MASDLASTPVSGLWVVQLCGDAHLGSFGGFASAERQLLFDLNDFDETLPGPWEWDVKRLAASIAIAGRELGFSRKRRAAIVSGAVGRYREDADQLHRAAQHLITSYLSSLPGDRRRLLRRYRYAEPRPQGRRDRERPHPLLGRAAPGA